MVKKATNKRKPRKSSLKTLNKKSGKEFEMSIKKLARKHHFKAVSNCYIGFKTKGNKQRYIEVDVVLISANAVIIVEAKNYSALIKDSLKNIYLKAEYENGRWFTLYNPVFQNKGHVKHISEFINIPPEKLVSLILFSDSSILELQDYDVLDENEFILKFEDLGSFLDSFKESPKILSDAKVKSKYNQLVKRSKVSATVRKRHLKYVSTKK